MKDLKRDNELMKILKVKALIKLIAKTNMGELSLLLRQGEDKYIFTLDSVELDSETQEKLNNIFFPL